MSTIVNSIETLIESHRSITNNINNLKAERSKITTDLLSAGIEGDEQVRAHLQAEVNEAEKLVQGLNAALVAAERHKVDLDKRIDSGDDTVTALEVMEADMAIRSTKGKIKPADAALSKARKVLAPYESDNHLALLVADVMESANVPVPVVIRKSPDDAPEVEPLVILSQTEPTENYGTLDASGYVNVTEVGETGIDWRAVKTVFDDTGSEGNITETAITFDRAAWPLPRLNRPSPHALTGLTSAFGEAFHAQAMGSSSVQRLVDAGYNVQRVKFVWSGLLRCMDETFEIAAPGEVVGEVTFVCAIQHEQGDSADLEEIKSELDALVRIFQQEAIGSWSEAGEIVSINLSEVDEYKGYDSPWSDKQVARRYGELCWPYTAEAKLRVTYRYQEA